MDVVRVFQDDAGEWRWQWKAGNGEIIAVSGEGYENKQHALGMAGRVSSGLATVEVDDGE